MYIDEELLKILEPMRGQNIDVSFMISLIKTVAEENEILNKNMKLVITGDLRDVLDIYNKEEISYSRMAEILNEKANERLNKETNNIELLEQMKELRKNIEKDIELGLDTDVLDVCFELIKIEEGIKKLKNIQ